MRHDESRGLRHPVVPLVYASSDGPWRRPAQPFWLACDGVGCSRRLACDSPAMKAEGRSLLALAGWLLVVERVPHAGERIRAAYCPDHACEGMHTPVPWLRVPGADHHG
jgi:hypothetical protein